MSFQHKIYFTLVISFALLLFSLVISYQNTHENSAMLQYLSKGQIKLNYYTHKLNYDLKKNQSDILQATMLGQSYSEVQEQNAFAEIHDSVQKLNEFINDQEKLSPEFIRTFRVIENRIEGYKSVQHSLTQAIASHDTIDIQDAIIGYNDVTMKFSKDTDKLIDLANSQLYESITLLNKNNDTSANTLLFSFIIAIVLITFSAFKFNTLQFKLKQELGRAESAEDDLRQAQIQLLKYNDDLESEISKKSKELHEKIYTHFLSGLPNRNKLLEDMSIYKFTHMAILNIDKFQSFNDVYGEETGNIALKMSGIFLEEEIKDTTMFLYHIGGDEFVVVSKNDYKMSNQEFIEEIERILKNFRQERFAYEDKTFQFMMSSGISFSGQKKMLAYADMALKDAKKRNIQLSIFNDDKELEKIHQEDIECHKKLVYGLENDGVISYFQPIVPIQDGNRETKYESLVRLRDQDGKIIPPFNFIRVAKANRIYHKVTKAVLHNTLKTVEKHQIPCSINMSLTDIENSRTMDYFFELLDTFKFNELLTVELLETEDFKNYELVHDFCLKVRSYGLKVALDDFGSGYSNFAHILQLPVDYIKIDASLISNIDRNYHSKMMVETIVELARKLNVLTIAEFVSSGEILAVVKEIGVDYAQGFYLGKPLDIDNYVNRHHEES
jgi:diguanylate cyclase (GGDEF)-like protein